MHAIVLIAETQDIYTSGLRKALSLVPLLLFLAVVGAQAQCIECGDSTVSNSSYGNIVIRADLIEYRDASTPDLNVYLKTEGVAANLTDCSLVVITDDRKITVPLEGTVFPCNERKIVVPYNEVIGNDVNTPDSIEIVDGRGKPIAITCMIAGANFKTMLKP